MCISTANLSLNLKCCWFLPFCFQSDVPLGEEIQLMRFHRNVDDSFAYLTKNLDPKKDCSKIRRTLTKTLKQRAG